MGGVTGSELIESLQQLTAAELALDVLAYDGTGPSMEVVTHVAIIEVWHNQPSILICT